MPETGPGRAGPFFFSGGTRASGSEQVMAEAVSLTTQPRAERGTQAARRLRRKGLVPAVLYGHKEATVAITQPLDTLASAMRHGARVVDLQVDSKTEKALIREVQWDHLGKEILHVDFTRVAADERVVVTVR